MKKEIVCSGCEKTTWVPEKNTDGIYYKWFRCNCEHEVDLNPDGPFMVVPKA